MLEVEYPSDVPQTLGLSILETSAGGAPEQIGLDSGIDVPDEAATAAAPALGAASAGVLAAELRRRCSWSPIAASGSRPCTARSA